MENHVTAFQTKLHLLLGYKDLKVRSRCCTDRWVDGLFYLTDKKAGV